MAKMSARTEFNYMPQLFDILDSQNGCSSPLMIDYSRNLDHGTSFDEECRRIQYEADIERNLIPEDMRILRQNTRMQGKKMSSKSYHQSPEMPLNRPATLGTPHIFADTKFESNPFSQALKVLNSDKDLIMKILSVPNCLLQTECEPFTPVSEAKHFLQKTDHQQSNKTATKNAKSSGKRIACNYSLEQSSDGSTSRLSSESLAPFSVREIKRKLKHALRSRRKESNSNHIDKFSRTSGKISRHDCIYHGVEAKSPLSCTSNAKVKEKLGRKQGLKVHREPHVAWETDTAHGKIDLPARLKDLNATTRESQNCSGSATLSFNPYSPMRSSQEVTYAGAGEIDEEIKDGMISPTPNMKCIDMPNVEETEITLRSESDYDTMIRNAERAASSIKSCDEYGSLLHSVMDSITVDCFPSSPRSVNAKNQEEHLSPVSVLDQFFADEYSSSSNTASQSVRDPLKARCLHFEEHALASLSQVPCMNKRNETISNYVRVIMESSCLDWDQLSAIRPLSEHLLHPSLFDQAQFLLSDPHFDARLLFDHVNEVLLETKQSHFRSLYWPALVKPRICCLPLEETVIDEIMREAQFYLLPQTEKRTLDELVAKDLSGSRLQLDVRPEIEQIIIHLSEDILEESVLDLILHS